MYGPLTLCDPSGLAYIEQAWIHVIAYNQELAETFCHTLNILDLLFGGHHGQHEVKLFLRCRVRQIASSWKATTDGLGLVVIVCINIIFDVLCLVVIALSTPTKVPIAFVTKDLMLGASSHCNINQTTSITITRPCRIGCSSKVWRMETIVVEVLQIFLLCRYN